MRKTVYTMLLGALFALASLAPAVADDNVSPDVSQAEDLYNAGKYDQALQLLDRYLSSHPQDARALADRGDVFQSEGKLRESIVDYTAALAINPQYAYAYASRGDSYNQLDDYKSALADANKALDLRPKFSYALRVRGDARLSSDDVAGAQADFHQAISIDPNEGVSYAFACEADRTANQLDVATKECATALQLEPKNYTALFQTGRLQIANSAWSDAEVTYSKLLAMEKDPGSSYWRAFARMQMHQGDGALADINAFLQAYPDSGDGLYMRAQIDEIRGDFVAAKKDATSALQQYGVDNDTSGMAQTKTLLDQLNAGHP